MSRPWTPTIRAPHTTRITLKRNCNGCGRALGDVTDAETAAAVDGAVLPDTRGECGCDWEQPPGINDDAYGLPPPAASAERILEFVKDFGDGRVYGHPDQEGIEPLYARDLESLAKAYLAATHGWSNQ